MNGNRKPVLIIIDCQGDIKKYDLSSLNRDKFTIGRNCENSIIIEDKIVSSTHGMVSVENGRFLYTDLHSTNGSRVMSDSREELLKKTDKTIALSDGALIRIGSLKNPEKMVLMLFTNIDGEEVFDKHDFLGNKISIGRLDDNDIILSHPTVSGKHALIEKRGEKYVISDRKSVNGVLVNGQKLIGERILRDKDVIQIVAFQLIFSSNCIYYKGKTGGISIKTTRIDKWVGKGKTRKQILRDAGIEIQGNEFVAIIGGSGAGKSTIMNVLNGFDRNYEGDVFYSNVSLKQNFQHLKNLIGYVPQDDIIYENLTLRTMLRYTAKLRMPDDSKKNEIEARIEDVLKTLDLTEHQDTFIRKMSGGQKKRASIAVELLADPRVFFLDEPTSGLDPGTEKNLMTSMKNLCKEQGRTIIMVTHTTQSLHLCDKVVFMGPGGRVCFVGNVNEAKHFFKMDDLTEIYNMIATDPELYEKKWKKLQCNVGDSDTVGKKPIVEKKARVSRLRQFGIVTSRYIQLLKNDPRKLLIMLFEPIVIGLLLFLVSTKGELFHIFEGSESMMFAMSCAAIWIGLFNSIQEICKERNILKREYMANLKLSVYMFSKVTVQIVLGLIQAILLVSSFIELSKIGGKIPDDVVMKGLLFKSESGFLIELVIGTWITILVSACLGLIVSSIVRTGDKAMTVAPFILIVQLLFSGILFKLSGASKIISYLTVSRWSVGSMGRIADLSNLYYRGRDGQEWSKANGAIFDGYNSDISGEPPKISNYLLDMFEHIKEGLIQDWCILLVMAVVCIIISIILLRNVAKDGR